jgi:hypothetical protein
MSSSIVPVSQHTRTAAGELKEIRLDMKIDAHSESSLRDDVPLSVPVFSQSGTSKDVDDALTTLPLTAPFEIDPRPPSRRATCQFNCWRGPTFIWAFLAGVLSFLLGCFCCRRTVVIISDKEMSDLFRWSWPYSRLLEPAEIETKDSQDGRSSVKTTVMMLDTTIMNEVRGFPDTCLQGGRAYFRSSDNALLYMEFPIPPAPHVLHQRHSRRLTLPTVASGLIIGTSSRVGPTGFIERQLSDLKEPSVPLGSINVTLVSSGESKGDSKRLPRLVRATSSSESSGSDEDERDRVRSKSQQQAWVRLDPPIPGISSVQQRRRWELAKLFFMSGAHHQIKFAAHAACHFPRQTLVDITKLIFEPADLVWRALEPHWQYSENINDNVLISPGSVLNARATTRSCFDTQTMPRAEIQKMLDWGARRFVLPMGQLPDVRFKPVHSVLYEWGVLVGRCYLGETALVLPTELAKRRTKMRNWCRSLNKHMPASYAIAEEEMIWPQTVGNILADYVLAVSVQHSMDHDGLYHVSIRKQPMLIRTPLLTPDGEFADQWSGSDSCCLRTHSTVGAYDFCKHTIYKSVFVRWINCCCGLATTCCCCIGCFGSKCCGGKTYECGTSCCDGRLTETRYDFRDVPQLERLQPLFRERLKVAIGRLAIPGLDKRIARSVQW